MRNIFPPIAFLLLMGQILYGQNTLKGKIIDSETKEPLAFATVVINGDSRRGVSSDIEGLFSYKSTSPISTISCSYMGYENFSTAVSKGTTEIVIALVRSKFDLTEVVIESGENPANAIMRKVIANKEINNPENISSFKYRSYNKLIYDYRSESADKKDSIFMRQKLKGSHFFMMESVTNRKFIKPDISEEVVIATKVSGFKNPTFASLATDFQPFSFYKDNIKLFNINYLNPISKGSLKKYKFRIEDTLYQQKDTVYILSFKPLPNKNFDGLKGFLYINTNKYAVQNVIASPFEKGKIDIKIQQQYVLIDDKYWFPQQLNYALVFNEFPTPRIGMLIDGKSYIDQVEVDVPLQKKDFSLESVRMDENAAKKDSAFWDNSRAEKLSLTEQTTYRVIDSIGQKANFDGFLTFMEKFAQGRIPIGPIDIDLSKTFGYNKYEGFRLGTGIYTNEKLSKNFTLGGFFGYGLKDYDWKYGGEVSYLLSKKNEAMVGAKFQQNLVETGNYGLNIYEPGLYNFRNYIGYQYDMIRQSNLNFSFRTLRYLRFKLDFNHTKTAPKYDYVFQNDGRDFINYTNSDLTLHLRFAYKEKFVNSLNQRYSMGTTYPVLNLAYTKGIKNFIDSDFSYNKIEATVQQSFFTKNFGQTDYRFEAGFVDNPLPYGLLFTGEGSYDSKSAIIMKNTFQTLRPYEFLSDRYVNLFLSHNFGGLLFKSGKFQPGVTWHNNIGWGDLSNKNAHQWIGFKTKDKIFTETGLQIDNILKVNYMNVAYLGLGFGVYYRYGAYSQPEFNDNLVFKFSMSMSIK